MMMMIRSMSPDVLIVDEIGRMEDAQALSEALNAGIAVIATVHARSLDEAVRRPVIRQIKESGLFELYVELDQAHSWKVVKQERMRSV